MKIFISLVLYILLSTGCQKESSDINNSLDQISFSTDKFLYSEKDSIDLYLNNKSDINIEIGLRCGFYMEMSYQKKVNGQWSDNLWFGYMFLRCPTHLYIVQALNTFTHSLSAEIFNSKGTFRLLVKVYVPDIDSTETIISNVFVIY